MREREKIIIRERLTSMEHLQPSSNHHLYLHKLEHNHAHSNLLFLNFSLQNPTKFYVNNLITMMLKKQQYTLFCFSYMINDI